MTNDAEKMYGLGTLKKRSQIEFEEKYTKPGHWIQFSCNTRGIRYRCSVCYLSQARDFPYCPECGAYMKEGREL